MADLVKWRSRLARSRWLPVAVILVTVAVLGGIVHGARLRLASALREQLAGRDGEVLHAVMQSRQLGDEVPEPIASIEDPTEQFAVMLRASRMKGVIAVRLLHPDGRFANALPVNVVEASLRSEFLPRLRALRPASRFHPAGSLHDVFILSDDLPREGLPLLEVNVPLHAENSPQLAGIAQFIIEGNSLAGEFARLDATLARQAWFAFLGSAMLIAAILAWAFRALARHSSDLQKANQQLALAARTSAVGAVTAHLIHGLKSPLSGLHLFVNSGTHGVASPAESDWHHAVAATRRMQTLINEVVSVLRDEERGDAYELTLAEVGELVSGRVKPLTTEQRVRFCLHVEGEATLTNRNANLLGLVLINLVQNGIQATPAGRAVTLALGVSDGRLICEVSDQGPGLPNRALENLFQPVTSSKEGGSGIGLAISKQLANHLGATLELRRSSPDGACFVLTVPLPQVTGNTGLVFRGEAGYKAGDKSSS